MASPTTMRARPANHQPRGRAGAARPPAAITFGLALAATVTVTAILAPRPLAGQGAAPDWLFPDRSLMTGLIAGPRDPASQAHVVFDWEGPTSFGTGPAGEVAISGTLPVARLAGSTNTDALVVGLEAAAFARFAFQVVTRELVNTDWIFAVPVIWHRGEHWLRLRYYHTSSHLGDEYQGRFGPGAINFSRDGADLTVFLRPDADWIRPLGPAAYGLVLWSVNSHPEEGPVWEARAGIELDPFDGRFLTPFLTGDVHVEQATGWVPRFTAQAGLWLPPVGGRPLRLALQTVVGPSPMGQFRGARTGTVGLGLVWSP